MTNGRRSREALRLLDVDKDFAVVTPAVEAEDGGVPDKSLNAEAEGA